MKHLKNVRDTEKEAAIFKLFNEKKFTYKEIGEGVAEFKNSKGKPFTPVSRQRAEAIVKRKLKELLN